MAKKRATFVDFLDKNFDLIVEYENVVGEDLWTSDLVDIDEKAAKLAQELKIGFSSVVNNCINQAIERKCTLLKVLNDLSSNSEFEPDVQNSTQLYFKEINKIYNDNNNDYDIPFCEENRDKIIQMNLKSVISIAKCYQGLGVDFQDLISAGNEGLCKAFEKYDPKRACLKDNIMNAISLCDDYMLTYEQLHSIIDEYLKYGGEFIKKEFEKHFKKGKSYGKVEILSWVDKYISNAKFNSVACKWIKAYIISEINNNSRVVKKPKSEIDKDKAETGSFKKEQLVNIDAQISQEDNSKTLGDVLQLEDDSGPKIDSLENEENYRVFKDTLNILLTGVKSRDRRILLMKFGIGFVRPMQPNEIAQREDLSIARISQIINATIETMISNAKKYDVNSDVVFEAISKLV